MSLSRADLTLAPAVVALADGREFLIRRLDALSRSEYSGACAEAQAALGKDAPMGKRLRAARVLQGELLFRTVLNADGTSMFTSAEDAASSMVEDDLDALTDAVAKLNRMGSGDPNV